MLCIRTGLSSGWKPPHLCGGKERFSAQGGPSVPICALALVAARKRGPFMVRGSHVSYQGTTLDGPKRSQQRFGLDGIGKKVRAIWISCYAHFASFMHLRFKSMLATWAAVGAPKAVMYGPKSPYPSEDGVFPQPVHAVARARHFAGRIAAKCSRVHL